MVKDQSFHVGGGSEHSGANLGQIYTILTLQEDFPYDVMPVDITSWMAYVIDLHQLRKL